MTFYGMYKFFFHSVNVFNVSKNNIETAGGLWGHQKIPHRLLV